MINILPMPTTVKGINRNQQFKSISSIYCRQSEKLIADLLIENICKIYKDFSASVVTDDNIYALIEQNGNGIFFVNNNVFNIEEYELKIQAGKIIITAASNAGFYYGCVSLLQLFPEPKLNDIVTLPQVTISDSPKYAWRGLLFDEARHFFGKDEVKRLIDILSSLKLNKFHWHLADDQGFRIQLDCYPQLTEIGATRRATQIGGFYSNKFSNVEHSGFYTKSDIKEVIKYAELRGVEIIPAINLPSHSTAMISALPVLHGSMEKLNVATTFGNINNIVCAAKEEVYEVLEKIITEICDIFPSNYLHLGGNDIDFNKWEICQKCHEYMQSNKLSTYRELLGHFFNKMNTVVKKFGKTAIIYSSAFSKNLDEDIILQYNSISQLSETVDAYNNGRKIILSPPSTYYFDYPNAFLSMNKVYKSSMPPIEFLPDSGNILGIEAALWTEWVYDREKIDVNLFPRIHAVAEKAWSKNFSPKKFMNFKLRVNTLTDSMQRNNICYYRSFEKKPTIFKRLKVRWQYIHKDQYLEVKQNRVK